MMATNNMVSAMPDLWSSSKPNGTTTAPEPVLISLPTELACDTGYLPQMVTGLSTNRA